MVIPLGLNIDILYIDLSIEVGSRNHKRIINQQPRLVLYKRPQVRFHRNDRMHNLKSQAGTEGGILFFSCLYVIAGFVLWNAELALNCGLFEQQEGGLCDCQSEGSGRCSACSQRYSFESYV